jgi:hypothetical protein
MTEIDHRPEASNGRLLRGIHPCSPRTTVRGSEKRLNVARHERAGLSASVLAWVSRLSGLFLALILVACRQTTPVAAPQPPASPPTSAGPATEASPLPAATAQPTPSYPAAAVSPLPEPTTEPIPTALPTVPVSGAGLWLLPARLAQISLAPAGQALGYLLPDPETGRLYVTDSTGVLHVLDADTLKELASLSVTGSWEPIYGVNGSLILDAAHDRLYVAAETRPEGMVTAVDTAALRVVGSIIPGGAVSLDTRRNRLYVGRSEHDNGIYDSSYAALAKAGGRVYDAETLELVGDLPVFGRPVYDPRADALLVVSFTVYRIDPDTLQVLADLLPDISAQPCPQCSGVDSARDARVDVDRNLVTVVMGTSSAGHPAPCGPDDRLFDATTLEPVPDPDFAPPFQPTCNEQRGLPATLYERAYASPKCAEKVYAYTLDGQEIVSLDGMSLGLVNPNTCQSYARVGDRIVVLDLPALAPVGDLPTADYTLDVTAGRLYGLAGADLLVFAEQGGHPQVAAPEATSLPARMVRFVRASPDYAHDGTVFVGLGTAGYSFATLYRSTDGGQSWVLLQGGLPQGEYVTLDLAISPGFAEDRTLFAGGYWSDRQGFGMFRSTDGGDTWQPVSEGLLQLFVDGVVVSPDYPADGTVLAYTHGSPYAEDHSRSVFISSDRGQHWALAASNTSLEPILPEPVELLPSSPGQAVLQFRAAADSMGVDRWTTGTRTWSLVWRPAPLDDGTGAAPPSPNWDDAVAAVLPSPAIDADHTVYVLTHLNLYRSTDRGDTWQCCTGSELGGRSFSDWLTAGALAGNQLLVGTMDGEFLSLDLDEQGCEPAGTGALWPVVLSGQWVRRIEIAPPDWAGPGRAGDIWFGTAGGGVYHYADGAIQDHYTLGDGQQSQDVWGLALASAPSPFSIARASVWASAQDPLKTACFDGQTWTDHTPPLPGDYPWVQDLAAGPDGTVWAVALVSTGSPDPENVLLRWSGRQWEQIDDPQSDIDTMVYDVAAAADGSVWLATGAGLARYSQGQWISFGAGACVAVAVGPDGEVVGLPNSGYAWRYAGGTKTDLPPAVEGPAMYTALYVARDGAVWIGTTGGISRYDGHAWRHFTQADGLVGLEFSSITEDTAGQLWIGTNEGAVHVDSAALDLSPVSWPSP